MSSSKKKETTKATTTTTPTNPGWVNNSVMGMNNRIDALGKIDPHSLVPGASPLQQQAFAGAANLGQPQFSWQTSFGGGGMAGSPAQPGTSPMAGPGAYDLAGALGLQAGTAGANTAGPAQGYQASGPAGGQGYQAAGPVTQFNVGQAKVGEIGEASSRDFTGVNLDGYLNAGLGDQITAAQADYDATNAAARARAEAQSAWNGGSRNSTNSILAAELEGQLSRATNTGIAGIRANAYDQAANLATRDLDRDAQVSMANASGRTQAALTQAGIDANRYSQIGDLQMRAGLDYAGRQDAAGQFGANAANQSALDYAGRQDAAGQFGAAAQNNMNQFNASQEDNALNRMLQGGQLLGSLGGQMSSDQRANVALQGELGGQQREIERQYRAAPYDQAALLQQLYAMQPYNLFNGQTSNTNSTTTQTGSSIDFARLAMAGLGFAVGGPAGAAAGYGTGSGISDPRMKSNIQPLGMTAPSGDALYQFNYTGDPSGQSFIGPMANEVAMTNPHAVGMAPGGVATVDYNALGIPSPQQQAAGANPLMGFAQAYQQTPASEEEQAWDLGTRQIGQQHQQANQQWIAGRARRGSLFGGK